MRVTWDRNSRCLLRESHETEIAGAYCESHTRHRNSRSLFLESNEREIAAVYCESQMRQTNSQKQFSVIDIYTKVSVSRDVTPCCLGDTHRRFRETIHVHLVKTKTAGFLWNVDVSTKLYGFTSPQKNWSSYSLTLTDAQFMGKLHFF